MSFRFRLIVTISLLIALTFGIGGSLLIFTSFSSDLEKERLAAIDSFETAQNTLLLLTSLSNNTNYDSLKQSLIQMENTGMVEWQAISLCHRETVVYQKAAEAIINYDLERPLNGQCTYMDIKDSSGYGTTLLTVVSKMYIVLVDGTMLCNHSSKSVSFSNSASKVPASILPSI